MEYCSPLWAGAPASQLAQLDTVEPRPSRSLESRVMKLSLWACHFAITQRLVVSLSSSASFCSLAPSALSMLRPLRFLQGAQGPPDSLVVKLPKSRITAHHSFVPIFAACGTNFHILFNLIIPSRPSRQLLTSISDHPLSKTMIFCTPVKPSVSPLPHQFPVPPS